MKGWKYFWNFNILEQENYFKQIKLYSSTYKRINFNIPGMMQSLFETFNQIKY